MQQKTGSFKESFSKNTFYRFLNNPKTNWLRFTTMLSKKVADAVEPLTGDDRVNAFVVDDSLFESFQIIINAMLDTIRAVFRPTEEQLQLFMEIFVGRLPEYVRTSLVRATLEA